MLTRARTLTRTFAGNSLQRAVLSLPHTVTHRPVTALDRCHTTHIVLRSTMSQSLSTASLATQLVQSASCDIRTLYASVAQVREVTAATFLPANGNSTLPPILLHESAKDIELDTTRTYESTFVYSEPQSKEGGAPLPSYQRLGYATETKDVVVTLPSPSGKKLCIVKSATSKQPSDGPNYTIDVYDTASNLLLFSKNTSGTHGKIFHVGTIGGIGWNSAENMICYIAERTAPKRKAWLPLTEQSKNGTGANGKDGVTDAADSKEPVTVYGNTFDYVEEWGEMLGGVSQPLPFVVDIERGELLSVSALPHDCTFGQVCFSKFQEPVTGSASGNEAQGSCEGLVLTAWPHQQRKLGLTHYNTRESKLYYIAPTAFLQQKPSGTEQKDSSNEKQGDSNKTISAHCVLLTPNDHSANCARVSPDGSKLIFVTTEKVWFHHSTAMLRCIDWQQFKQQRAAASTAGSNNKTEACAASADASCQCSSVSTVEPRTVVDVVHEPCTVDSFPGLYTPAGLLPRQMFLNNNTIILNSTFRFIESLLVVQLDTGALYRIPPPTEYPHGLSSCTMLHARDDKALVAVSTPNSPSAVYLLQLNGASDGNSVTAIHSAGSDSAPMSYRWLAQVTKAPLFANKSAHERVQQLQYELIQIACTPANTPASETIKSPAISTVDYTALPFEALLIKPAIVRDGKLPPLILTPHGGPHGSFTTAYNSGAAFLAAAGMAVLHVNYRGSTGYGQQFLASLPGKCGVQDVHDCMEAARAVLNRDTPVVDRNHVAVWGGSHGGFLTGHLIGQYPDFFASAATRNPVMNVAHMAAITDIPDWCFCEVGLPYDRTRMPTAADYAHMFSCSPVAHVGAVKTPLLMLLGTSDRRVPISQAVDYYKLLRARGVNTRLLMYPDAQHSLADKVSQELDIWINTALWLLSRNHSTAHALLDSTHDATAKSVSTTARNIDVSLQ